MDGAESQSKSETGEAASSSSSAPKKWSIRGPKDSKEKMHKGDTKESSGRESDVAMQDSGPAQTDARDLANLVRENRSERFLLRPDCTFVRRWDLVTGAALLFTASVTPFEVAFMSTQLDALFFFNRLIDSIFVFDMMVQFCLCYERHDPKRGVLLIRDRKSIAKNYMKGWFAIDLVSIVPFDVLGFALGSNSVAKLRTVRVVRLLRLLKLIRVVRASRIVERWQAEFTFPFAYISMVRFAFVMIVGSHWAACVWGLVGVLQLQEVQLAGADPDTSWILYWASSFQDDSGKVPTCSEKGCIGSEGELYLVALYWAVMTITSIGYGDVVPRCVSERVTCVTLMWAGGVLWAFCIGSICGIVSSLDPQTAKFHNTMDDVNRMLERRQLPNDLRLRVRRFFYQSREVQLSRGYQTLLEQMSPQLQQEVARSMNDRWLLKVWWVHGTSDAFVAAVAKVLVPIMFAQGERIDPFLSRLHAHNAQLQHIRQLHPPTLYILSRGIASRAGRVMMVGDVWGEDFVLRNALLRQNIQAMCLTYVETLCLPCSAFFDVCDTFPVDARFIRKNTVRLAVIRGIKRIAQECKRLQAEGKSNLMGSDDVSRVRLIRHSLQDGNYDVSSSRRASTTDHGGHGGILGMASMKERLRGLEAQVQRLADSATDRIAELSREVSRLRKTAPQGYHNSLPSSSGVPSGIQVSLGAATSGLASSPEVSSSVFPFQVTLAGDPQAKEPQTVPSSSVDHGAGVLGGDPVLPNPETTWHEETSNTASPKAPTEMSPFSSAMDQSPIHPEEVNVVELMDIKKELEGEGFTARRKHTMSLLGKEENIAWINTTKANTYIGAVIMLNSIMIGLETDYRPKDESIGHKSVLGWYIVENIFVVIFVAELLLRLRAEACRFWRSGWNNFDFILVCLSVADTWIISLLFTSSGGNLRIMSVLRILRLLRLVRVLRLFRLFTELWQLLNALLHAVRGLTWVMLLLGVTCYTFAILMTIHLGHNDTLKDAPNVQQRWGTVPKSMFTLFIVMTGEGWNEIAEESMDVQSILWLFFVPFVIFTNLMVMNLVVGVIVDKIMEATNLNALEQKQKADDKVLDQLLTLWLRLDKDCSNTVEIQELQDALLDDDFKQKLRELNIFVGKDAKLLIRHWDKDESGVLEFQEFVEGAMSIKNSDLAQQLLFMQYDLQNYGDQILNAVDECQKEIGGMVLHPEQIREALKREEEELFASMRTAARAVINEQFSKLRNDLAREK